MSDSVDQTTEKLDMGVDPYERRWMIFSIITLVVFVTAITIAGFALGIQVPDEESRVDPQTFTDSDPWSNPGLREIAPGEYEAYVVAQVWSFSPAEIEVPVGSTVDIYVASKDVQHGFRIQDSNVNMQIVPGQVSHLRYEAKKVGTFPYICTEYCGSGHAVMHGTLRVVEAGGES